jgi:mannose-6-phosphate isomerase-like protein (cupin superfamily)
MPGEHALNWRTWVDQRIPATEIQRGGAAVWPKGSHALIGDPLGPVLHLHDGASEIFYFLAGRCRLEIGNSETLFGPGDFVLIPPQVPHNLWNAGEEDLLVFWIVAPNLVGNKWRTTDFPPGSMASGALCGRVERGVDLPSDANIRSRLLTLRDSAHRARTAERQEAILYVTEGHADVTVGRLAGRLRAHEFVHVPVDTPYSVAAAGGPATVLLFQMPGG